MQTRRPERGSELPLLIPAVHPGKERAARPGPTQPGLARLGSARPGGASALAEPVARGRAGRGGGSALPVPGGVSRVGVLPPELRELQKGAERGAGARAERSAASSRRRRLRLSPLPSENRGCRRGEYFLVYLSFVCCPWRRRGGSRAGGRSGKRRRELRRPGSSAGRCAAAEPLR